MQEKEVLSSPPRSKQVEQRVPRRLARVLGSVAAAAIVLLMLLAWAVLLPALHAHVPGSSVGSTGGAKSASQAKQSAAPPQAERLCTFTDTRPAAAGFAIDYSLGWSATGKIAFTHRDSVVVDGTNCAPASSYHDRLNIPQGAVWSPDGKDLLAFTFSTTGIQSTTALQIVDGSGQVQSTVVLETGGPVGSISPIGGGWLSTRVNLSDNQSFTWGPAWSPDGSEFSAIFSPGGTFSLMTWETQGLKQVLNQPLNLFGAAITSVAWSPNGQYVAIATDNPALGVLLVNAHTGALVTHLAAQNAKITNLTWSPDGQELATASGDNEVRVWQLATGAQRLLLTGATSATTIGTDLQIAWSPDGQEIAAGDQRTVVWNVGSGHIVATIQHADRIVVALAWSPDSQRLATLSTSGAFAHQPEATLAVWRW